MNNEAYFEYLEKLKDPDLTAAQVEKIMDDAEEDPRISCSQFEALWFRVFPFY